MQHFKRLILYSGKYLKFNILGSVLSIGVVLTGIYIPFLTKEIVDDGLVGGQYDIIAKLILMLFGLTIIRIVSQYIRDYIFEHTSQKVLYDFRSDLYNKLQMQSFAYFDKVRTGTLMNRMVGDLQAVRQLLNTGYRDVFEGLFQVVATLAMMITLSPSLTLALVVLVPITFFIMRSMARKLSPIYRQTRASFEDLSSTVQENLTGIRVVKAFGREEYEKEKFEDVTSAWVNNNIKAADIRAVYIPVRRLVMGISTMIILLFGGYLAMQGRVTVGTLLAFNKYMVMLSMPINNASALVNMWENAKASLEKVFELLDEEIILKNKEDALPMPNCQGDIEFRNVQFAYDNTLVLDDITFRMKPGTTTAIMGNTGSGKSTIINLIARFYDCTAGEVLIDGINVQDYDYNELRSNIGIILQETLLFSDTIANNIAFAKPDATQEEIEQAAKIADAHEFILEMPYGYDTVIGERGVGLSGGQRQRIAIARAIIFNPKILILDDATSSVDMETEHEIQTTLKSIMADRTTLVVAHRISSVKDADQILVIDNGKIIEQGTHDELLKLGGNYHQTFIEQYREFKEESELIEVTKGGTD